MSVRTIFLEAVFVAFLLVFAGCVSNPLLQEVKGEETPPQLLLAGKLFGLDFSHQIFAKQTKCYDLLLFYNNPSVTFRAICYNSEDLITDFLWVRSGVHIGDLVEKNLVVIAKERALKGIKNTNKIQLTPLGEIDAVTYHEVSIGDDYSGIQATLYLHTAQADAIGLTVVVMVKGKNSKQVESRIMKIKSVLQP